jgi:hypothetical protein
VTDRIAKVAPRLGNDPDGHTVSEVELVTNRALDLFHRQRGRLARMDPRDACSLNTINGGTTTSCAVTATFDYQTCE